MNTTSCWLWRPQTTALHLSERRSRSPGSCQVIPSLFPACGALLETVARSEEAEPTSRGLTLRRGGPEAVRYGPRGPRVLVVDDEESITDLVGTALRYEGFQVEVARSGRDALAAAT